MFLKSNKKISYIIRHLTPDRESLVLLLTKIALFGILGFSAFHNLITTTVRTTYRY